MTISSKNENLLVDVQRREVVAEVVSKDGVQALAIEKKVPGGSTKRLLLLNKVDAQALREELDHFLKSLYAAELNGMDMTLSPADMAALFGEDDED